MQDVEKKTNLKSAGDAKMRKEVTTKEDGRTLVYYTFEPADKNGQSDESANSERKS